MRPQWKLALIWACVAASSCSVAAVPQSSPDAHRRLAGRDALSARAASAPLLANATASTLAAARQLVKDSIAKAAVLNKARIQNPARDHYTLAPGTIIGDQTVSKKRSDPGPADGVAPPPLLAITPEIAAAAALVAEADAAAGDVGNGTSSLRKKDSAFEERASSFWMEGITRQGTSPFNTDSTYQVFRNVKKFGAVGDGKTDDTKAIWKAMIAGSRCANGCNGSSNKFAIVYFPAGQYLVSTNITVVFGTQLIGDPTNIPTIKASAGFVGLGVLSTDVYVGNGAGADGKDNEWYINTASFYRQIRNVKIDITATDPNAYVAAIHYQVAQATSLQNVELVATTGTTQQGMYSENGSGGFMSDVTFTGGAFGFYGGNQQFTVQRMTFNGCDTAVQIIWDWAWVWKSVTINNAKTGFLLHNSDNSAPIGSLSILDSKFTNVKTAVVIDPPNSNPGSGSTGLILSNVALSGVGTVVADTSGNAILAGGPSSVEYWVLGPVYNGTQKAWYPGTSIPPVRSSELLGTQVSGMPLAGYFERVREQYLTTPASGFVQMKSHGAKGDGKTDDTAAVQSILNNNVGKIIFADAGVYVLTNTVYIPPGTKIVGEAWTQFAATGSKFGDATQPIPMFRVGNQNETGSVEMQDLLFTTIGPTPGVVLVEWNIKADSQGSAALWDCHARLGGATGTQMTPKECPAATDGSVQSKCMAASLMMHLTPGSSGYFENMWLWTADHMIDDADLINDKNQMVQVSVYSARGMLVESTDPVWLYATASEHSVFYQFNFYGAMSVYGGLLQTESPYYQPKPSPPAPYASAVGAFDGDPDYSSCGSGTPGNMSGCDSSWAVMLTACENVQLSAMGVYSWFVDYTQACVNLHTCQNALVFTDGNFDSVRLEQLVTIGAGISVAADGTAIPALDNLAIANNNASWSQITVFDVPQGSGDSSDDNMPLDGDCDWTVKFADLNALQNALNAGTITDYCAVIYTIPTLSSMLNVALANYSSTTNDYDKKFNAYVEYIHELVPTQLDACMDWEGKNDPKGPCNQYFSCVYNPGNGNGSVTACPPPGLDYASNPSFQLYYTLTNASGLWAELETNYGIDQSWVTFGTRDVPLVCTGLVGTAMCPPEDKIQYGYPQAVKNFPVPNPKDIFTNASYGFGQLQTTLLGVGAQMILAEWTGNNTDVAQTLVMPVSMAYQAAQAMQEVVVIGGEVQDADRKHLILTILGAIFMVVPFLGDGLGEVASDIVANLGRIISLIGAVGTVGVSAYGIVEDKSSAPMQILNILMGVAGVAGSFGRDSEDMANMATLRRGMSEDELAKLGSTFKENDDIVASVVKACAHK